MKSKTMQSVMERIINRLHEAGKLERKEIVDMFPGETGKDLVDECLELLAKKQIITPIPLRYELNFPTIERIIMEHLAKD